MARRSAGDRTASSRAARTRSDRSGAVLFEAQHLAVSAGGQRLLAGVDLTLQPAEITAITGPSGCGKTTLLRVLAGLVDPSSGGLRMRGLPPVEVGWPAWRRRAVFVAQRPVLTDALVRDNLSKPFEYLSGQGSEFVERRAVALLSELGMPADVLGRTAWSLSEGQQQRLALARALLVEPDVLLLDEPTSALDPVAAGRVEERIRAYLAQHEAAAAVVTHDPQQAARLGDHLLALESHMVDQTGHEPEPGERGDG